MLQFSLHGYNVASVAAGNATTSKSTLQGYFHQYYGLFSNTKPLSVEQGFHKNKFKAYLIAKLTDC